MTTLSTMERAERAGRLIKVRFHISREHAEMLNALAERDEFEPVLRKYAARDSQPAKRLAAYLLEKSLDELGRSEGSG